MLAAPFTFQTRCARIVVPLLVSRRCEQGSWPQWAFLLASLRSWGTVADWQRKFLECLGVLARLSRQRQQAQNLHMREHDDDASGQSGQRMREDSWRDL
jgi:hypothetical protein